MDKSHGMDFTLNYFLFLDGIGNAGSIVGAGICISPKGYDNEWTDDLDDWFFRPEVWIMSIVTGTALATSQHPVMFVNSAAMMLGRGR